MAYKGKVFDNTWKAEKKYNDLTSHFTRLDAKSASRFFAVDGYFVGKGNTPNWLENTEDGFELVQMDGDEVISRTGLFIRIEPNPKLAGAIIAEGKGKTVAFWNYSLNVPNVNEPDKSLKIHSEGHLKGIVAYADGSVYSNAVKSGAMGGHPVFHNSFVVESIDMVVPHTAFATLAFFMWLEETEEGKGVHQWLVENMGWTANASN